MRGLALEQLVAFERVVREGSFSRAALALKIGQPAVSSRIHGLEAALGPSRGRPRAEAERGARRDVVRLGRPLYRLRWWQSHHPEIDGLAAATGRSLEIPMDSALHLVRRGRGVGFFPRGLVADDLE